MARLPRLISAAVERCYGEDQDRCVHRCKFGVGNSNDTVFTQLLSLDEIRAVVARQTEAQNVQLLNIPDAGALHVCSLGSRVCGIDGEGSFAAELENIRITCAAMGPAGL